MPEELLIRFCAPTLAGMKTGSMFTCPFSSFRELAQFIHDFNHILREKGLRILPLRCSSKCALIYVYRPVCLRRDLENASAQEILCQLGYPCESPERCVVQLMLELRKNPDFPHEIGLFLGYPPEDVRGFIENKAKRYKCCGCWKVYGDVKNAQRLFAKYKKCTDIYVAQWYDGQTIERLTVAV